MTFVISIEEQNQFLDKEMQPILNKLYKKYTLDRDESILEDGVTELYKLAKSKELTIFQSKQQMINEIKKDIEEYKSTKINKFILKCCGAKLYKGEKCLCIKIK